MSSNLDWLEWEQYRSATSRTNDPPSRTGLIYSGCLESGAAAPGMYLVWVCHVPSPRTHRDFSLCFSPFAEDSLLQFSMFIMILLTM